MNENHILMDVSLGMLAKSKDVRGTGYMQFQTEVRRILNLSKWKKFDSKIFRSCVVSYFIVKVAKKIYLLSRKACFITP